MKLCYCDESGTGSEPIATMAGIVVDSTRMHITKQHWGNLLTVLTKSFGRTVSEIHTRNFYNGRGLWYQLDGTKRAEGITTVLNWLKDRKHRVVFCAVDKESYKQEFAKQFIPDELQSVWRFMGFHIILSIQKCHQSQRSNKGHTLFVFDNEERERVRFTDLVATPPAWSGNYYDRGAKQEPLDQIVDTPYFGDSKEVYLIQVADLICFLVRRYAEIKEGYVDEKYKGERDRLTGWVEQLRKLSIGQSHVYPKRGREKYQEMFYRVAPTSISGL